MRYKEYTKEYIPDDKYELSFVFEDMIDVKIHKIPFTAFIWAEAHFTAEDAEMYTEEFNDGISTKIGRSVVAVFDKHRVGKESLRELLNSPTYVAGTFYSMDLEDFYDKYGITNTDAYADMNSSYSPNYDHTIIDDRSSDWYNQVVDNYIYEKSFEIATKSKNWKEIEKKRS